MDVWKSKKKVLENSLKMYLKSPCHDLWEPCNALITEKMVLGVYSDDC